MRYVPPAIAVVLLCHLISAGHAQISDKTVRVDVAATLKALLDDEDTDNDRKITIDDPHIPGSGRGDKRFLFSQADGQQLEVTGTYYLSNLLQELKRLEESQDVMLAAGRIFADPVERILDNIRLHFWQGLTRRIDEQGLPAILSDEKMKNAGGRFYLYVPSRDSIAIEYFAQVAERYKDWMMEVVRLPKKITGQYIRNLEGRHGLISLALGQSDDGKLEGVPFVVPGGRFNEMYGWDSYFIVLGLIEDGKIDLAKSLVDNFVYEIEHCGAILNANRTYYLTRSQPPFLTSMARACYEHMTENPANRQWLRGVLKAAIREYTNVWMNPHRLTATGLSRYFDIGSGGPPEVEQGHFDAVFAPYAKERGMTIEEFERAYRSGRITVPALDAYFTHDRCMRESGHDTSYRLEGCCADVVTVDLNSLLYKIESDIAEIISGEFGGRLIFDTGVVEDASTWRERADRRKGLINTYLWNEEAGMFFDYDVAREMQTSYVSATTFYPMWAGLASKSQALRLVDEALPLLEMPGGVAGSTEASRGPITPERPLRQWDYPHGWAPHQMLLWRGLLNYGFTHAAQRLAYRWLYTITLNAANYNGTIPEKFDVVRRSHQVFAEYGNVGTTFSYITREGFGWTNASFQVGLSILPPAFMTHLNHLIPPEWVFPSVAGETTNPNTR